MMNPKSARLSAVGYLSIGEVEETRRKVANFYADWCFERSERLPREWLTVDTSTKDTKAKALLVERFEACYPFHPATLSVFQRKWRALSQFQQTRGALAMLAQWISATSLKQFRNARKEPLITLGSAPLDIPDFRAVVLGQIGENRLDVAIDADIAGRNAHARALDASVPRELRDIHQRVGTAIFFESTGGQMNKVAQLPELRFALGETAVDTTAIDNAAVALERNGFFIRKMGAGYKIHHKATLKKVVSDRRASLNEETEINPAIRKLIEVEFRRGATLSVAAFPENSSMVQDTPRLILLILDPETEWSDDIRVIQCISQWTKHRGQSPRLFPGSLVWCAKSSGRGLREKVELWLSWKIVEDEINKGLLGAEFDHDERVNVRSKVESAKEVAKNEVWASYRFVVLSDPKEPNGLRVVDLAAGHSSSRETLCGRVIAALKSEGLLNENVGVGYIDRNWPPALKSDGAWPLNSLRKSFLDGSLTRLADPENTLRAQILRFVSKGDFGLGSGTKADGGYARIWYNEQIAPEDIEFAPDVFLLTKTKARSETTGQTPAPQPDPPTIPGPGPDPPVKPDDLPGGRKIKLKVIGNIPSETWNRFGTRVMPKLRTSHDLHIGIEVSLRVKDTDAQHMRSELRKALDELDLGDQIRIE